MKMSSRRRQRGSEVIEFALCFLPLVIMLFMILNIAWAVFAKSTLEYAVRVGVRYGITVTGTQATAANSNLTAMVKSTVQSNALGLLSGTSGLTKIKVHYFQPPAVGSTGSVTDVSTSSTGNLPGNIMQVSVEGFTLSPLLPRIFSWNQAADSSPTAVGAVAADLIEPSNDVPPIGTAP